MVALFRLSLCQNCEQYYSQSAPPNQAFLKHLESFNFFLPTLTAFCQTAFQRLSKSEASPNLLVRVISMNVTGTCVQKLPALGDVDCMHHVQNFPWLTIFYYPLRSGVGSYCQKSSRNDLKAKSFVLLRYLISQVLCYPHICLQENMHLWEVFQTCLH